ncbi:aspartate kinase [Listeria cornellensis]|uniref:Aspartokinase n=1 Tax=Listeria cornellensis FSL F6-0969 TaxID=1265820 RepID=W7BR50_9LIST|nr:aspartate kinase [Listeria cornellensis]EUJ25701.1 aspartate kinase [Listeria cornellensis FSL F6-0969]
MKVIKFGGSSLASAAQLQKVYKIVVGDSKRKFVVVSAPGKRFADDVKVTDLLIDCGAKQLLGETAVDLEQEVLSRYASIAEELGLGEEVMARITRDFKELLNSDKTNPDRYMDRIKASGEDNNAKLIAAFFRSQGTEAHYVNPKDAGLFVTDEPGNAQVLPESYDNLYKLLERDGIVVFPGFFGYTKDGEISTFSRSGSDITGAIVANGVKAEVYENFTDVDAVYAVNPSIVQNPRAIVELTYREMRELSYAGFSVFHDEALVPAFQAGIPVQIKNTNRPELPGTRVIHHRENTNGPVVGIASDGGFCSIYITKYLMNREIGFGRKVLEILEDVGLTYEHMPSGIDDLTIILRENQMDRQTEITVLDRLKNELASDEVIIEHGIALVMVVGEAMKHNVGTTARASKALSEAHVNIEMINQGSSEVSIMFGVKEDQEKKAVHALYNEFFDAK